jgi:mannose-1-phosphate guanylyltransferase/phosphomannomutase
VRIREFVEKPKLPEAPSGLVNAGVYLMEPPVIDRIASGRKVIIEREVFPFLAKEGKLLGYVHSGTWFDIGNVADYIRANFALLDIKSRGRVVHGEDAKITASAKLTGPLYIGNHTTVEGNVKLGPQTIVGSNVKIGANATISGSVIFDNVVVGDSSLIENAVVGNSVVIGREAVVGQGSVIAGHVNIGDHVRLAHNVYVHPHKEVNEDIPASGHVV